MNIKNKKIIIVVSIISAFIFVNNTSAFTVSKVDVGDLSLDIKAIEEYVGITNDRKIKITKPAGGVVYSAGDTIEVAWNFFQEGQYNTEITLLNVKGKDKFAMQDFFELDSKTSAKIPITNDIPTGDYIVMVSDIDNRSSFDLSKEFKIKTTTDHLRDDEYLSIKKTVNNSGKANDKAIDAAIKATLSLMRAGAEIYYDRNSTYKDVCIADEVDYGMKESLAKVKKYSGKKFSCKSNAVSWAAEAKIKSSETYYCVDSTGFAGESKKSKGSSATTCDGKKVQETDKISKYNNAQKIVIDKVIGLKDTYKPYSINKFSVKVVDQKGKAINFSDNSIGVSGMVSLIDTGSSPVTTSLGLAKYNSKKKTWDFDLVIPAQNGKYVIDLNAYCIDTIGDCYKKFGIESGYVSKYVYVEGGTSTGVSKKTITVISPNGGETISNTGAVNIYYTVPTDTAYAVMVYLIPSSDTEFNLVNPQNGIKGYSLGGGGSRYVNTTAIQGSAWNIGAIPDGKYKIRTYLYPFKENLGYQLSEAIAFDESDKYFVVNTKNANKY
jgi:putative hemolysin